MIRIITRQPFTVVFAVVLGLVAAPLLSVGVNWLAEAYDESFPVVEMHGDLVRADRNEVVIRISGVKRRSCTYLRLQALARDAGGTMTDANIQRSDLVENGDTKLPGRYYLGEWRIWPRGSATAVIVNANHLCGDRLVVTRIAGVQL